ncbi:uncharacterized protein LOC111777629 isoform X1 [Cucurbita pepo subsp. pepo]|uniref:uncharacterized protein LOC111777629 isoform X1 n=3 Tax=Cucurbita pepo subsp. pepo TaxID=3664 RepID=UPI000C9D9171|nr:uncharacterized protein LOC111777629 isoform X1 [Cucurbita pepo subsp. pepo]
MAESNNGAQCTSIIRLYQQPNRSQGFQMAGKGNERLDCTHASNPYHVCFEHCSEKKGESKKQIARKYSGDGAMKYSGERKKTVRSDCSNGSNPYHNCNEFCSNITTQSGRPRAERNSAAGSGGATKDSRPKSPRKLNVSSVSAVSSKPQVTKARGLPEENTNLRNGDYIKPYAEETCFVEDSLTIEEQNKFSHLILVSANSLKTDASSITYVKSKEDIKTRPDEVSEIVQDPPVHDEEGGRTTASLNITSFPFPDMVRNHIKRDEDEVKSVLSEPSVPVGKYYVKASSAPILQSIFNKHGDIAASCKLESTSIRSYYLESVCYIIQELQHTKFSQKVSKSKVKELLAIINDLVSSEMNVGWLHSILNDVAEAVESSSGQQWSLEVAKANCDHELELTKKELESRVEDLTRKEKEMSSAKAKVVDTRARLSELELKYGQLNEEISSLQLKVNGIKINTLTDQLL